MFWFSSGPWGQDCYFPNSLPSLKLTAKAPKNGWLEYFLLSYWVSYAYFQHRTGPLVSGRVPLPPKKIVKPLDPTVAPEPLTLRSFDPGKDRAFLECRSGEFICLVKAGSPKISHNFMVQNDPNFLKDSWWIYLVGWVLFFLGGTGFKGICWGEALNTDHQRSFDLCVLLFPSFGRKQAHRTVKKHWNYTSLSILTPQKCLFWEPGPLLYRFHPLHWRVQGSLGRIDFILPWTPVTWTHSCSTLELIESNLWKDLKLGNVGHHGISPRAVARRSCSFHHFIYIYILSYWTSYLEQLVQLTFASITPKKESLNQHQQHWLFHIQTSATKRRRLTPTWPQPAWVFAFGIHPLYFHPPTLATRTLRSFRRKLGNSKWRGLVFHTNGGFVFSLPPT